MNNSQIFKAAHKIAKQSNRNGYSYAATFAAALRYVINVLAPLRAQIKAKLRNGINAFRFLKADGKTERLAFGTLDSSLYSYQPKGSGRKGCPLTIRYWDLEKKAFRSFNLIRFIEMLPKSDGRIVLSQDKGGLYELEVNEGAPCIVHTEQHGFGDESSDRIALRQFDVTRAVKQLQDSGNCKLEELPF